MHDPSSWFVHDAIAVSSRSHTILDIIKPLDEVWVKGADPVDNFPLDIRTGKIAGRQLSVMVVLPTIFFMRTPTGDYHLPQAKLGNNPVPCAVNPTIRQQHFGLYDPDLRVGVSRLLKDSEGIPDGICIVTQQQDVFLTRPLQ